jgi:TP901 family phage tail tape measure protein
MARTSATISVGADTRQLERDIQSALSRDFKFKGFNEKAFTQPLGRITGAANEFQKSLDASNARVIAFGASAGLIYTVEKAFTSLVKSTIDVQKSLTDINVILNVSTKTLDQFGNSLFDIAKNTGQSFDVVAQAATELSRQGLGLEETLKRTQDALILTRLSGLDTVSAVEALTATINSFNKAGLDSTVIINKLANVDAAFAVSSGDLAEAIKRVGSSASDAGVDFDELLAIVTSVQQTTARGGAVIGNSLKTIFTRIQRTDTLDQLEQIGIKVRDLQGNTLPAIQVLSNLSNTFNTLADSQKAQVAETVGGIFQINILKAALADLGKEYSVYDRALQTASNSTDQAIQRNEALNQTLSSLINQTFQNLTRISSDIGKISLGPTFKGTLELLNKGLESLSTDSDTVGGKIGKGILEGIGTFISGPGVILLTAVFGKLLLNLGKFASQSLQTLLSVNSQAEQRVQIQAKINEVLSKEPGLVAAIYSKQISVLELENRILDVIKLQTLERERAASLSTAIAGNLATRGVTSKGGSLKAKSGGFIPNFSAQEIYGALAGGYMPGNIQKMNIPGQGNITYNGAETVKNFPGMTQPAIMPPQGSKAGKNYQKEFSKTHGFNPYANNGFIPNFASYNINGKGYRNKAALASAINRGEVSAADAKLAGYTSSAEQKSLTNEQKSNNPFYKSSSTLLTLRREGVTDGYTFKPKGKPPLQVKFPVAAFNPQSTGFKLDTLKENLSSVIDKSIKQFAEEIYATKKISPPIDLPSTVEAAKQKSEGLAGAVEGTIGGIFEAAFRASFGKSVKATKGGGFDVASIPKDLPLFFNAPGSTPPAVGVKGDFKNSDSGGNRESMAIKILKAERPDLLNYITKKNAALGFIPNFTALDNAIGREVAAGTSTSRIRIGKDSRLTSSANPLGLGVYNTKDEPRGLGQGIQRYGSKAKMAGAAAGFIPNFAGLSFNPGGLGALDPAVANREIGTAFGKTLAQLKKQEITLQQANMNLQKLSADYGLAANSQNRFNQILQSRASQYAASAKNAALALDKSAKGFGAISEKALALSLVLPIALQTIGQFSQGNKKLQIGIDALSTAVSLAAAGSVFGAPGAVVGGVAGTGLALYQFFDALKNLNLEKLKNEIQFLQDEFNNTATSVNQIIPLVEKYKEVQASSLPDTQKIEALGNIQNQISENLGKIGPEFANSILEAIKNQNYDQVGFIINKALSKKSAEISNLGGEALFQQVANLGIVKDKNTATGISRAITSLQTESGKNVIQQLSGNTEGRQTLKNVSNRLNDLYTARGQIKYTSRNTMGFSAGMANFDEMGGIGSSMVQKSSQKEIEKQSILLKTNLIEIVKASEPLYQSTDETRKEFERISKIVGDTALNEGAADKIIKDIKRSIDDALDHQEKITALLKSGISTVDQYILAFKDGTLNAKDAQEFYKKTFALQNDPLKMLAKNQNDLNMSIATTILNQDSRNKVLEQLTVEEDKLREKLTNRQITEDQYNKALEGLKDKIILEQRKQGTIFAEDFRSGRQQAREANALANETKLSDFAGAFFDEFDNSTADSFRQIQLGAKDTANTIKSEFNNAFLSFANGTATASDAFTKMALNISDKIQQLALEWSTNQVFGALFGTTSNVVGKVGGGGGGIGDFFSSLLKSKGGIIKGYSTGGHVLGGSGNKDDVPAMLSGGEYVIRKNAVKKYGTEYLQMLNQGKVNQKDWGGVLTNMFSNAIVSAITTTGGASSPGGGSSPGGAGGGTASFNKGPSNTDPYKRKDDSVYFRNGGRVQRFASGGEASYLGTNVYRYNDPLYPTQGENVISPNLSLRAVTDPNNPQNKIRQDREMALYDYLNYVEGVRLENERALKENIALNKKIQDEYNQQQNAKSRGAWMSFGFSVLGAGANQFSSMGGFGGLGSSASKYGASAVLGPGSAARQNYANNAPFRYSTPTPRANGGYIRGFANGGSSGKDDIPALLMGGEFVMRKEAVNMYGKKFLDDINSGRARKFAEGGVAGSNSPESSSNNYSPTNNVNIVVNLNQNKTESEQNTSKTDNKTEVDLENQKAKQLAAKIKNEVMKVINEQQRPGGLLRR